jgi:hypothetical protein
MQGLLQWKGPVEGSELNQGDEERQWSGLFDCD